MAERKIKLELTESERVILVNAVIAAIRGIGVGIARSRWPTVAEALRKQQVEFEHVRRMIEGAQ